ncbi:unnamed protein product, partial [Polarella glacialis]
MSQPPLDHKVVALLTKDLDDVMKANALLEEREKAAKRIRLVLAGIARQLCMTGEVQAFGSFSNGFKTGTSDLDVVFLGTTGTDNTISVLGKFASLAADLGFENVTKIFSASVPLVKFTDVKSQMEVDFCINNELGVRNSLLLQSYSRCDNRVLLLGRLVKDWAKKHELVGTADGYLNSYAAGLREAPKAAARHGEVQQKAAELGVKVEQGRMDMSSQAGVDKCIKEITPNLMGFIHSAGVLQDAMLPNQTWEKFEAVYDSKHRAALYLHDSLDRFQNPNLQFLWLFSSTSAYGNMGQSNYSASNSFLDALARHRVATGKPCTAIHWGAWGEVGMAANMDEGMRKRVMMGPMPYFSVAQGLQGLEGGLKTGLPEFSVFIVNPPAMFGMIQGDGHPTQRYMRNWTSEWLPTPSPSGYQ